MGEDLERDRQTDRQTDRDDEVKSESRKSELVVVGEAAF